MTIRIQNEDGSPVISKRDATDLTPVDQLYQATPAKLTENFADQLTQDNPRGETERPVIPGGKPRELEAWAPPRKPKNNYSPDDYIRALRRMQALSPEQEADIRYRLSEGTLRMGLPEEMVKRYNS